MPLELEIVVFWIAVLTGMAALLLTVGFCKSLDESTDEATETRIGNNVESLMRLAPGLLSVVRGNLCRSSGGARLGSL